MENEKIILWNSRIIIRKTLIRREEESIIEMSEKKYIKRMITIWEDKNEVDRYIYERMIKRKEGIGNYIEEYEKIKEKKNEIKIKSYIKEEKQKKKEKKIIIEIGPKKRKEEKGKGMEMRYRTIMKIRRKYGGEYSNEAHIYELLREFCNKIIRWEKEEKQIIMMKEEKKNMNKNNIGEGWIPRKNKLIRGIKAEGKIREERTEEGIEKEENKRCIRKREEDEEQEWNRTKRWKERGRINERIKHNKEIIKKSGNKEEKEEMLIHLVNYFGWRRDEENGVTIKIEKKMEDMKWISRTHIEIDKLERCSNKYTEEVKYIERKKEEKNTIKIRKVYDDIIKIKRIINKKTVEYIMKTKNIYGSIIYLRNYWKKIIEKNRKERKKKEEGKKKERERWEEKGKKKCRIKKKVVERKIKKKEEKKIGIYEQKKREEKGKKERKKEGKEIRIISIPKIIKTEIMYINAIKMMENIEW